MRSVTDVKRNQKLQENVNITKTAKWRDYRKIVSFYIRATPY